METNLLLTIILLFVVLILVLVIIGLVVFILFKNKTQPQANEQKTTIGPEDLKKIFTEQKNQNEQVFGLCAFCEKSLIKSDFFEIDKLHFCRDHFDLYTSHKWTQISNELTTGNAPESAIYIYNFKNSQWEKNKEPMYILCEYKIDVINDEIETYVQLHVIEEKAEMLKRQLEKQK